MTKVGDKYVTEALQDIQKEERTKTRIGLVANKVAILFC